MIDYKSYAEWEEIENKTVLTAAQVNRVVEIVSGLRLDTHNTFPFVSSSSLRVMQGELGLELRYIVSNGFRSEEVFILMEGA